MPIIKKCVICSKEIITYPSRVKLGYGIYCSKKCRGIHDSKCIIKKCLTCGKEFTTAPGRIIKGNGKYCSLHCSSVAKKYMPWLSGKDHHFWKGGKHNHSSGYITIYAPNNPSCKTRKYMLEHRLVMEAHLGRYLTKKEVVHHRGIKYPIGSIENKQDNRIENLELFKDTGSHVSFHAKL